MTLMGNSGIIPGFGHIAAPYGLRHKNLVFVEWEFRHKTKKGIEKYTRFKRMTLKRAQKEGRKIITCIKRGCHEPATQIDHHHFAGYCDYTLCEKHVKSET